MSATEVDLLERCRAGDRRAYRALVAFWGEPALRLAATITGEPAAAERAAARAFVELWHELPRSHSESPFRPWLLARVAAAAGDPPASDDAARACLVKLPPEQRLAVLLRALHSMALPELALALDRSLLSAAAEVRAAERAVRACLPETRLEALVPAVRWPAAAYDEQILPRLRDPVVAEVRRVLQGSPAEMWRTVLEPSEFTDWMGGALPAATTALRPGSRWTEPGARGVVTTLSPGSVLAWRTTLRFRPAPRGVELRFSLRILGGDETQAVLRLHGVAPPRGRIGRWLERRYQDRAAEVQRAMHRRLDRLASTVAARA